MHTHVQYPEVIEPLVKFIEETSPEKIVEETVERLRYGVSIKEMSIASALAVIRSSELPEGHHGGPLHPVAGSYAVNQVALRLSGEKRFLPLVQNVALVNKHIHHPAMAPYLLPEFDPIDAGGMEETKRAFFGAVRISSVNAADHHFLWLAQNLSPEEAFDLLLTVAIPKNLIDDHKLIYPVYTWKFLEWIDMNYFQVLMRGPVRYVSMSPRAGQLKETLDLIEKYQLLSKPLRQATGEDETEAIVRLRAELNSCAFAEIPEVTAKAIADGLSLEGTGECLSLAASDLFLRSDTGNPMDVHMNTGANVRRHILRVKGVSIQNKLLALLTWNSGPEVRPVANRLSPEPQPHPDAVAAIPRQSQKQLLESINEAIIANEMGRSAALVEKYGKLKYEIRALTDMLAEIACQDNYTEMHALKHHQASFEEFQTTRAPLGFRHFVAAAKAAAISYGKAQEVYQKARKLLY